MAAGERVGRGRAVWDPVGTLGGLPAQSLVQALRNRSSCAHSQVRSERAISMSVSGSQLLYRMVVFTEHLPARGLVCVRLIRLWVFQVETISKKDLDTFISTKKGMWTKPCF